MASIFVSDHSVKGLHTFWGRSKGWSPVMGMKQVEPPYLYGYAVRIGGRFFGVCREKPDDYQLLLRELPQFETQEIRQWGSSPDEPNPNPESPSAAPQSANSLA